MVRLNKTTVAQTCTKMNEKNEHLQQRQFITEDGYEKDNCLTFYRDLTLVQPFLYLKSPHNQLYYKPQLSTVQK